MYYLHPVIIPTTTGRVLEVGFDNRSRIYRNAFKSNFLFYYERSANCVWLF